MVDANYSAAAPPVQWPGRLAIRARQALAGRINKPLNEVVGGWQLAGDRTDLKVRFSMSPPRTGVRLLLRGGCQLPHNIKTDTRRSRIAAAAPARRPMNGSMATSRPQRSPAMPARRALTTVVSGLPSGWVPYQEPMDNLCAAPSGGKAVIGKYSGATMSS